MPIAFLGRGLNFLARNNILENHSYQESINKYIINNDKTNTFISKYIHLLTRTWNVFQQKEKPT